MTGLGSETHPFSVTNCFCKEGFNPIIDIAANAQVQKLCKHNIEVNLVKCFGVVQVDDISISTSLEDVKQVVEMVKKLTETRPPSAKAMLVWVEKIVVLEVCNEVSSDNFFKYLDDMRCQRDRSVVDSISFAISFVVWCYH